MREVATVVRGGVDVVLRLDERVDQLGGPVGVEGLTVEGTVPGIDNDAFAAAAEDAKKNCPVSQALTGTTITLSAKLA